MKSKSPFNTQYEISRHVRQHHIYSTSKASRNIRNKPHYSCYSKDTLSLSAKSKQTSLSNHLVATLLTCEDSCGPDTALVGGSLASERAAWKKI